MGANNTKFEEKKSTTNENENPDNTNDNSNHPLRIQPSGLTITTTNLHPCTSDTSTSNSNFKKRLFPRKNNKNPSSISAFGDESEFISPSASASINSIALTIPDIISDKSDTVGDDDPMIMAAANLSDLYDKKAAASSSLQASSAPREASQPIDLAYCQSINSDGLASYSHTNSAQSNSFHLTSSANKNLANLRPVPRQQQQESFSRKMTTKEWLSSSSPPRKSKSRFISSQDVMLDLFLQPNNDIDRRKEKDRQQRLHYLLKRIWKGIYRAKLNNNPTMIVDWCCGIGMWDMEMALLFPDTQIVGVDFKEATLSNLQHNLPNLEFRHTVIHDTFTGLESFEDNSVDFVMMRDVWLINTPVTKWDNVLKECFRILKPGGWIEIAEHSLSIQSKGPYITKLDNFFKQFCIETQVDRDIAVKLGQYLTDSGFQDIDAQSIAVPLGEWGSTAALKETGYLFKDVVKRRARGLAKWVCEVNNLTEKEYNQLVITALEEEVDEYHSYINSISYTGRKATSVSNSSKTLPIPIAEKKQTLHCLIVPTSHSTPSTETSSMSTTPINETK